MLVGKATTQRSHRVPRLILAIFVTNPKTSCTVPGHGKAGVRGRLEVR